MKAKKIFCIIAYDISDDRRRLRVVKELERVGVRVNYSVFECMLTPSQLSKIQAKLATLIYEQEDSIIYYPICLHCFSKIVYQPARGTRASVVAIV